MKPYLRFSLVFFSIVLASWHPVTGQSLQPKEKQGKYGFFRGKKMVQDFRFDTLDQGTRGYYRVREDEHWGAINPVGDLFIPCVYDQLAFTSGLWFIAKKDGYYGALDSVGARFIPFQYEEIDHVARDGSALVKYHGTWCMLQEEVLDSSRSDWIFHVPDVQASFPGCDPTLPESELKKCSDSLMFRRIIQHIRYPALARENGVQGIVVVQFVISETGKMENPVVLKHVSRECDAEALRVVSLMPDWIPAREDGLPVASYYILPIRFILQGSRREK